MPSKNCDMPRGSYPASYMIPTAAMSASCSAPRVMRRKFSPAGTPGAGSAPRLHTMCCSAACAISCASTPASCASSMDAAQLAGVLAHEIAHAALQHMVCNLGAEPAPGVPAGLNFLRMTRGAEQEADMAAVGIMYDAGYDPRGMSQFFEGIQAKYRNG